MTSTQQVNMFGCTLEQLKKLYEDSFELTGPAMMVMSVLSDVQELIEHMSPTYPADFRKKQELARQYINRAKFGVTEYLRHG